MLTKSLSKASLNEYAVGASVSYTTGSTAEAENAGSQAVVSGMPGNDIIHSHATDIWGPTTSTIVETSNTTSASGVVVPHVEMTPLAEVHELLVTPLP